MAEKIFEVLEIQPDALILSKKGGSWPYNLHAQLMPDVRKTLEERQKEKWETLAFAVFGEPKGEKLGRLTGLLL